jgi:archaemetzincin
MTIRLLPPLIALLLGATTPFTPPGPAARMQAIGPTAGLAEPLRRALEPADAFAPIPAPGPRDWLANHPEAGQTFEQFVRSRPNRPSAPRKELYFQPLGEFAKGEGPPLERLRQFAVAFFAIDVAVLPTLSLTGSGITSRRNPRTRKTQLLTRDILALLRRRLPADAFAVLGITLEDLYPEPSWNFVFGEADLRGRVGVYSFARYDPRFFSDQPFADRQSLLLRRSCKVLAHETAHMFGIEHCIFFDCLMNGSNHLAESDARPMHLCPVDLRKLHHSTGFDVVGRYRRLRDFCRSAGFADEERWLSGQLARLTRR